MSRETTLSIGTLTAFVATTRAASGIRSRSQAPNVLSIVSATGEGDEAGSHDPPGSGQAVEERVVGRHDVQYREVRGEER